MKEELGHCSVNQYRYILRNKRHQSPCNPFPIPFAWGCSGVHRITGGTASESVASQKATCSSSPVPATANTNYLRLPATPAASPRRPLNPPPPSEASCHPQASFYFRRCRISQPPSSLALAPRTRWMSRGGWSSATSSMVPAHVTPNIRDLHYTSVNQTLSSSPLI